MTPSSSQATPGSALRVIAPAPLATIQDLGRYGYQRFGVSVSGAMDVAALHIANALVGNPHGEAAIEFTLAGGSYIVEAEVCRVAMTGGAFPLSIDGVSAASYASHTLRRGSRIAIGSAVRGCRGYLAVGGGFDLEPALGSRSTHLRSGLGGSNGAALVGGQELPLRNPTGFLGPDLQLPPARWPVDDGPLRVVMGPQEDYYTEAGKRTFLESVYRVTPQSDRMGYRLEGPEIQFAGDYNIISDGIAPGSVQVVGNRQPIILLADRQTTGGYPKIATVISADLPRLAQRQPGDSVRFEAISIEAAEELGVALDNRLDALADSLVRRADAKTSRLLAINLIDGVAGGEASPD